MLTMRLSPTSIAIALLVISLAALGLGVFNFMKIRNVTTAVVAHHNLLDHAEFDNIDPSIKAYYLTATQAVMPEISEYANLAWASLPAYAKDASKYKKVADALKKARPGFANLVKMMPPDIEEDSEYPALMPPNLRNTIAFFSDEPPAPKPMPPIKPITPAPKPIVITPAKPAPSPAKTTLKIA